MLMATFDHLWRSGAEACTRVEIGADEPLRPRCLWRDRRGWTWIGTRYRGVFVLRPGQSALHLSTRDGLRSDAVWSIAEDAHGNVYFGTANGIGRWDAGTGAVREFAAADVLPGEIVQHVRVDGGGRLWASTTGGLSRLPIDSQRRPAPPPRIYLTHVHVDGEAQAVPENGTRRLFGVVLAPGQRRLEVGFVGLEFHGLRALRYQHRLRGLDAEWSAASEATAVQFADLAPGDYELSVRAVDADGRASLEPAQLEFRVLPPLWQEPWFVTLCAASVAALFWWWHRVRLRRAVATERLRTQIATDLHDEVGAGLAQIAILTEVARRDAGPALAAGLGEVAGLARGLREAMSDIVWALAQGHDTLADLVQRMRQLAGRMLEVDGTQVVFVAPAPAELDSVAISIEQRRQLWLWFKEALANVVRHAGARRVDVDIGLQDARLRLLVRDDGRGFAPEQAPAGNGLPSLRQRAARLQGGMVLRSAPGAGTELELTVPLPRRRPPA
jgi:signal transduction histidine kinase